MHDTDWKSQITDPAERRIFEALDDRNWDWRTVGGIVSETGLDEASVRRTLSKYPVLIHRSSVRSEEGEELYTLKQSFFNRKGAFEKVWDFISPPSSSSSS